MLRNVIMIFYLVIWYLVIIIALTWGVEHVWPDYVHVDYGYPQIWGIHTVNTFHGPVDIWRVNITALCTDLAIWLTIMIVGLFIILYIKRAK